MSATAWGDDLSGVDAEAPIGWMLTPAGWLGTRDTLSVREAATVLGVAHDSVRRIARRGLVRGVQVGRGWILDRTSVDAYRDDVTARQMAREVELRRPRSQITSLPAAQLLEVVDTRGGPRALGVPRGGADDMALYRARKSGWLTERAADRLAVRVLGLTPLEVWGPTYDGA